MKRLMILILALILLTACVSCTLSFRTMPEALENDALSSRSSQPAEGSPSSSAESILSSIYFNEKVYETSKQQAQPYNISGTVTAGIIPHHGTASGMIASFFETLTESYDTVILIGPNHYEEVSAIVYADCGWHTEKGDILCDSEFVQMLKNDLTVDADAANKAVQNDHSIGWHLPYIADYLPESKLAAIMLRQEASETELKGLAQMVADYAAENKVLLIGSVDFSHYLMPDEAREMDELTKSVISAADYGRLMRLDSNNVDSPKTVYVVMKALELMGAQLQLLDQSISYEQAGGTELDVDPEEGTTTYLVYAGTK
ncbi:MAG: AmmeMemoRadiSam system protein B [Ruminococcaceae bacterium]|nr:AmmeMemoRadiSam system protein B [Oscillospiraceae bacterium]